MIITLQGSSSVGPTSYGSHVFSHKGGKGCGVGIDAANLPGFSPQLPARDIRSYDSKKYRGACNSVARTCGRTEKDVKIFMPSVIFPVRCINSFQSQQSTFSWH
jgi:hypothetical protein